MDRETLFQLGEEICQTIDDLQAFDPNIIRSEPEEAHFLLEAANQMLMKCKALTESLLTPKMVDNDFRKFIDMLEESGIGHGIRIDHNPVGKAVIMETADDSGGVEFWFDDKGKLVRLHIYDED